jgi:hypothetical protein
MLTKRTTLKYFSYLCNMIKKDNNMNKKAIGNFGMTLAKLYNEEGKLIGVTLDTPNAIAYALSVNNSIADAQGILGFYNMQDINSRVWFAKDNKKLGEYLKFNK